MQLSRYIDIQSVGFSTAQAALDIDCADCEGVLILGVIASTAARTPSIALKTGATTTGLVSVSSTFTNSSTAAGVTVLCTDVYKPWKRFVQATLSTTTATPSYCIAMTYGRRKNTGNFTASAANMGTANGGILRCVAPSSAT